MEVAQQLTADNLDEAMDGLAYEVAGTFLEELDEDNIRSPLPGTDDQQYFLYAFPPLRAGAYGCAGR